MKKFSFLALILIALLCGCNNYNALLKSGNYSYKYEVAKQYYAEGHYNRASMMLSDVVTSLKGTEKGEESLYLLGMSSYKARDYDAATTYFKKYYQSYPRGLYSEEARYMTGIALYESTPEPRLDQSGTYEAVSELQGFLDAYPESRFRKTAQEHIFELQDKLVEKEYLSAKLYYDLGAYIGNGSNGNYQACIVTAENALRDYPYMSRREDFSFLILKAKFDYAKNSVASRQEERYNNAIDEYYGFQSEFPESKYAKEAESLFRHIPQKFRRSTSTAK
ncbi:MAG: outer membrane protein assembly factor BamD [Alloprevotella sp.]|nr:outer membrane protein assembly factor BamD [Alloprevotella sp.]